VTINRKRVKAWCDDHDRLVQALLVLVAWTSGQPPRAPEHVFLKKARTENGPGSMHIFEGQLYLIPPHLKTNGLTTQNRTIPRRPQPTTGALLMDYFNFFRPAYELAYEDMGLKIEDTGFFYLYKGKRYSEERVGRVIEHGFALYGKMIMLPSHFRQGVQTCFREHLVPFLKKAQNHNQCDAAAVVLAEEFATTTDAAGGDISSRTHTIDAMADHSTTTAVRNYGVTKGDDAFLTPVMWRAVMDVTRGIHFLFKCDDGVYAQWETTEKKTSGMASTRLLSSSSVSTALLPAVPPRMDADAIGKAAAGAFFGLLKEALPSSFVTHAPPPPMNYRAVAEAALGEMLGSGLSGGFRNEEQADTFMAMWKGELNTLVVLPTGGGKSLLFCLLAKLTPGMYTIVVVPLASLLHDLESRARAYGVQVHSWSTFRGDETTVPNRQRQGLLLIAAENVKDEGFTAFLGCTIQRVTAWIWEEAHLIGMQGSSFRPALLAASHALPRELRVLAFTATMPPVLEETLQRHLLRPHEEFKKVIRSQAVQQPHMVYQVEYASNQSIDGEFITRLYQVGTSFLAGNQQRRGIVYFPTVVDVSRMAAKFIKNGVWCHPWARVYVYHSQDTLSDLERQQNMSAFKSDKGNAGGSTFVWLFATSGAGTGLDVQDIGAVIVYKYCYGVLDLLQYFGRCRQGVGEAGLGLVFTSQGALREFGGKLRAEEQRLLDRSDTYEDKTARLTNHKAFQQLLLLAQEANHQCCLREFLGNANSGEGTGMRCPDVPSPGANWCQGCVNKRAGPGRFLNVEVIDVAGRGRYQGPPHQHTLSAPSTSFHHAGLPPGRLPGRSATLMPGGTSQAMRSPQVSSQQFGLSSTLGKHFLPHPFLPAPIGHEQGAMMTQQFLMSSQYPPHFTPAPRPALVYRPTQPALGYNPLSASPRLPSPSLTSPPLGRRLSPAFQEPYQQPPSATFRPGDHQALPGLPAQRAHLVAPASTPYAASSTTPSSGMQPPPRTAAFPELEVLRVIENHLEDCFDENNYLKACPYCLALTGSPFGIESDAVEHNPSMTLSFFLQTCPQFKKHGILSFKCHECLVQPSGKQHNSVCMVRGYSNGLRNAVQQAASKAKLVVCGSCQIKGGANATSLSFHSAPNYAFGPKTQKKKIEEEAAIQCGWLTAPAPACKLNDTHIFIRFAWTLYLHRRSIFIRIVGHRVSFQQQWTEFKIKNPLADEHSGFLPYLYHWLHQDWYQGAAFNNAHVLFVLFTNYFNNGASDSPVKPLEYWYEQIQNLHK